MGQAAGTPTPQLNPLTPVTELALGPYLLITGRNPDRDKYQKHTRHTNLPSPELEHRRANCSYCGSSLHSRVAEEGSREQTHRRRTRAEALSPGMTLGLIPCCSLSSQPGLFSEDRSPLRTPSGDCQRLCWAVGAWVSWGTVTGVPPLSLAAGQPQGELSGQGFRVLGRTPGRWQQGKGPRLSFLGRSCRGPARPPTWGGPLARRTSSGP